MTVKAKHWIKTADGWHSPGEVFEVESIEGLDGKVEKVGEEIPQTQAEEPKPATRSRKRSVKEQ